MLGPDAGEQSDVDIAVLYTKLTYMFNTLCRKVSPASRLVPGTRSLIHSVCPEPIE